METENTAVPKGRDAGRLWGLVLAGGAVGGGSWLWNQMERHLRRTGEDAIRQADHVIATSAGAAVAGLWAGGVDSYTDAVAIVTEMTSKTPKLGRLNLAGGIKRAVTSGMVAAETIAEHFEPHLGEWPANLTICVWDVDNWQRRTLTRNSGVSLAGAIAASCALPPVIAAHRIPVYDTGAVEGETELHTIYAADAGISSNTNADLAARQPGGGELYTEAGHADIFDPLGRLPGIPAPWEAVIWTQHQTLRRREQATLEEAGWTSAHIVPDATIASRIWRRPWRPAIH